MTSKWPDPWRDADVNYYAVDPFAPINITA